MTDCHMHMILDGEYWRDAIARHAQGPDIPWIRRILQASADAGFTYLRDGGARWGAGKAARELAGEYGICYRTPLSPLFRVGHYGAFIGTGFENLAEYARLVARQKADGADFIKIMISGLMDFDRCGVLTEEGLPPEEIRELIHIAHDQGMAVMAHCNGARTMEAAAVAGVDSIEHGAYPDEDALQAIAACGTVWVPTLSTVGNLRGKGRFSEEAVQEILARAMTAVARCADLGGMLAPGSDAGAWAVPHGCKTEYTLLSQALGEKTNEVLAKGIKRIQERFL